MFNSQGSQISSGSANYIENVFSTYLYTGNGTNTKLVNNIALGRDALPSETTATGNLQNPGNVSDFFASGAYQGAFRWLPNTDYTAGQFIKVDFVTPVTVNCCTYRNSLFSGSATPWAPTQVWLQSSNDDSTWTTRVTYNDATGSEAINSAIQYIKYGGTVSARYWRMYQATNTRGNSNGYNWGVGDLLCILMAA
mgnify:CR=1 FL=1